MILLAASVSRLPAQGGLTTSTNLVELRNELKDKPHFLEGMLDTTIAYSAVKLKVLYPFVEKRQTKAIVKVSEVLLEGDWPETFTVDQNLLAQYANGSPFQVIYDYEGMELLVFRAKQNGVTNFGYGVPTLRVDDTSPHWSSHLIFAGEAERAVRELQSFIEQKYSGPVSISTSPLHVFAEGSLQEGKAVGAWTFRYFGTSSDADRVSSRIVDFDQSPRKLLKQESFGALQYQYTTLAEGFKELNCCSNFCSSITRHGDLQTLEHYTVINGDRTLNFSIEGYLDKDGEFVRHGTWKTYAANGTITAKYRYRKGKKRRTFSITPKFGRQIGYCDNGGWGSRSLRIDTLSFYSDQILRRVVKNLTEFSNLSPDTISTTDIVYQHKSSTQFSSFRLELGDTIYNYKFDLKRGYGVQHNKSFTEAGVRDRIFSPYGKYEEKDFWPVLFAKSTSHGGGSVYQSKLANGVINYSYGQQDRKKHGAMTRRYSTGQMAVEGNYNSGEPIGQWTFYDWDGTSLLILNFDSATKKEIASALLDVGVWNWVYQTPASFIQS